MAQPASGIPALLLSLTVVACAGGPRPTDVASPGPPAQASPAEAADSLARDLDAALARQSWEDLRIEAECLGDAGNLRSASLLGNGVGVWNRQRQFTVPRERMVSLLQAFRRAGFAGMRESYGGKGDPAPDPPAAAALELICRVHLVLDGTAKQVLQLAEGRQSPELKQLAEEILAVADELGPSGATASSLDDGLAKIGRGELAPEVLSLGVNRQRDDPNDPAGGWLLRVAAGVAEVQEFTPAGGYSEPRRLRLSRNELAELARRLAEEQVGDLPINLWSPVYVDLEVGVLSHRKTLQARRFAGMTAETHGEKQERFDRIHIALEALHARVMSLGPPGADASASRTGDP